MQNEQRSLATPNLKIPTNFQSITHLHEVLLSEIYCTFDGLNPKIRWNTDQIKVALFLRILSGGDSIVALVSNRLFTYIPMILRSMLEARVDLINLIDNHDYIRIMTFCFAEQESKFLSECINDTELAKYFENGEVGLLRYNNANKYKSNNADIKKCQSHRISNRFVRAGVGSDYCTTYNELCRATHNNIDKLMSDHFDATGTKYYAHTVPDLNTYRSHIFVSSNILIHSSILVSPLFGLEEATLDKAINMYTNLQDTISSDALLQPDSP